LTSTLCACRIALKAFANPDAPATEGDFAPLRLVVPEDSMFDARYPAPTFMISNTRVVLVDLLVRALSQAAPEWAIAGHYGNLFGFTLFGEDPRTRRLYIQQEPQYGGWGATRDRDGENALIFMTNAGCRVLPAEALESRFPLRLERFELRRDSGGAGRLRGGVGVVREYRLLEHEARMMVITDRRTCPPWGMDGGGSAAHCTAFVGPTEVPKAQALRVPAGGVVSLRTGGGGGCGDPLERDVGAVRRDVVAGYVSAEQARTAYGVVVDPQTLTVDEASTRRLRAAGGGS
jgi:N-methylhydantoinase B